MNEKKERIKKLQKFNLPAEKLMMKDEYQLQLHNYFEAFQHIFKQY